MHQDKLPLSAATTAPQGWAGGAYDTSEARHVLPVHIRGLQSPRCWTAPQEMVLVADGKKGGVACHDQWDLELFKQSLEREFSRQNTCPKEHKCECARLPSQKHRGTRQFAAAVYKETEHTIPPSTGSFPPKKRSAVAEVELWCDPDAVLQKVN